MDLTWKSLLLILMLTLTLYPYFVGMFYTEIGVFGDFVA